ncbi:response regulator transcription factor [Tissierella sp. MSJ-40]|uniref:Response regulator transcription factor n=1 Tax=Tissierella simiarum TaxID=2841534 RepID=A0ABS6EAK3_9FIRM|nr:response regulator transcription factor [Tissierella simiarum]MBU5439566.1 response regulator transcription factor [Tissierella simiarum]
MSLDKKILIIDDEKDIVNLIGTVLKKEGFTKIYKSLNGNEGLHLFNKISPDLVILDIMLGDMEGYEICKYIREKSNIPILFLSAKSEELDKILGFSLGADDYITKPFSPKELAYRVKAHLRRSSYMENFSKDENFEIGPFVMNISGGTLSKNGTIIDLKPKELKILEYLAKNPNQIKTKEQIYDKVWGEEYIGDDNTIMVHIRRLRKKIEDNPSNPKYILTIKGLGYKFTTGD